MGVESVLTEDGKILKISVNGDFNFSLQKDFRNAYSDKNYDHCKIIVDLSMTKSMDSSALGMLIAMQSYFDKPDGEIHIINANEEVSKIIDITHLDSKFTLG